MARFHTTIFILFYTISLLSHAYSSNTWLHYASYAGKAGLDNWITATVATPDGSILLAHNTDSTGYISRINTDGTILTQHSFPGAIHDIALSPSDTFVAASGTWGIKVFSADLTSEFTGRAVPYSGSNPTRVACDEQGRILSAFGDTLSLWDTNGIELSTVDIPATFGNDRHVKDIACGSNMVFVGGYRQAHPNLQSPFLYALTPLQLTNRIWRGYDYWMSFAEACTPYALTSDSQIHRLEWGLNGGLYLLGYADGGVSLFQLDGSIPPGNSGADATYVHNVEIDNYNKTFDSNSARKSFFARIDPAKGIATRGQWLVPRWSPSGSNTRNYRPGDISVDESGNVYIGGASGFAIAHRAEQTVNDFPVYDGDIQKEPVLLIVTEDFSQRVCWTPLNTDNAIGTLSACAARNGTVVFAGEIESGFAVATTDAHLSIPPNAADDTYRDAYIVVYSAVPEPAYFISATICIFIFLQRRVL